MATSNAICRIGVFYDGYFFICAQRYYYNERDLGWLQFQPLHAFIEAFIAHQEQGYASYSVYKGNEAEIEIDTPNVSIHPVKPGRYRIQVSSDGESNLIVREGEADVSTPQGTTTVKEGQIITIRGTDDPEYKVETAPPSDDWDRWNLDRDHTIENAGSWQNTDRYYTGSQDLDANGRWINIPGYCNVWQPNDQVQNPNWAPYQDGRWVWEPGWGWTWVSYESWGWTPYHYGRWFYWNTGWVWWPGPIYYYPYYRPLWAPAYVSFFGFGGHFGFGVGFGFGSVGWLPCGPFDPFFPWWGGGFGHVNVGPTIDKCLHQNTRRRDALDEAWARPLATINKIAIRSFLARLLAG